MKHPIVAGRRHGYRDTEALTGEKVAATWGVKQARRDWRPESPRREGIHTHHIGTLAEPDTQTFHKAGRRAPRRFRPS